MIHPRRKNGALSEPPGSSSILWYLDGDVSLKYPIVRPIDFLHPAPTNLRFDPISATDCISIF